jgi:hypothetical protein
MLQLSGEEAQVVVDAIQLVSPTVALSPSLLRYLYLLRKTLDELRLGDEFYRHALYLLVKLASNSNILPTSLFVSGVDIGAVRDPIHGGGFADIYQGRFEGMDVAVKKLRFHGGDREQLHRVRRVPHLTRYLATHSSHIGFLPRSSRLASTKPSERVALHRRGCGHIHVYELHVHGVALDV